MAINAAQKALIDTQLALAAAERLIPQVWSMLRTAQRKPSIGSLQRLRLELDRMQAHFADMLGGIDAAENEVAADQAD